MTSDNEEEAVGLEVADPKVGWIYKLNKGGLVLELCKRGLDAEGTVEEMRRRLVGYLRAEPSAKTVEQPIITPPTGTPSGAPGPSTRSSHPLNFDLLNQIRKLNIVFDGKTDPVSFLERLSQVRDEYTITDEQLLRTLPGLLQGKANQWYMNYKREWQTGSDFIADFKTFFYPPDYRDNLEETISKKYQTKSDTTRDFVLDMQTLIRRRGGYSKDRELTCIYKRLRPEYRRYIRRSDVDDISELLQLAYELDQITKDLEREENTRPKRANQMQQLCAATSSPNSRESQAQRSQEYRRESPRQTPRSSFDNGRRNLICWRCGENGHTRFDCRGIPKLFCSRCGKEGTQTRHCDCGRNQGNAAGPGAYRGLSSPKPVEPRLEEGPSSSRRQ